MYLPKKLTRLHWVLTMIKEYNQLIQYIHMKRGIKKEEIKSNNVIKQYKND